MNWGELREQFRRSAIKEQRDNTWTDLMLRDFCHWALDDLCAHTAYPTATAYPGDEVTTSFPLPSNIFSAAEDLDSTGLVYLVSSETIDYLQPVRLSAAAQKPPKGNYAVGFGGNLLLGVAPQATQQVWIEYFSYYPHPYADSDPILVPSWAITPLIYRMGVHALTSVAVRSSALNQWKDRGDIEANSLFATQRQLIRMYEEELSKHMVQNRSNAQKGKHR